MSADGGPPSATTALKGDPAAEPGASGTSREPDRPTRSWNAIDWRHFYEERAGIGEHVAELDRAEAEAHAYEASIVEWLNRNPARSRLGRCTWCGKPEAIGDGVVLPFGTEACGHAWLHYHCWLPWHAHQRKRAAEALAVLGIVPSCPIDGEA